MKIGLHDQLLAWRAELVHEQDASKRLGLELAAYVLGSPRRVRWAGRVLRTLRFLPRWLLYHPQNVWGRERELPEVPSQSFRDWHEENRG